MEAAPQSPPDISLVDAHPKRNRCLQGYITITSAQVQAQTHSSVHSCARCTAQLMYITCCVLHLRGALTTTTSTAPSLHSLCTFLR